MIHIAFGINDGYAPYCGIAMLSLCENNKGSDIHFHILHNDNISLNNKEKFKLLTIKYGNQLDFHPMNEEIFKRFPIPKAHFGNSSMYYRILLPDILPADIHKVIYLDADLIVMGNITELWNANLSGKAIGVIPDMYSHLIHNFNRLEYDMEEGYFNSGVLVLNLDYWRANATSVRVVKYIESNGDKLIYCDQDALNYVLRREKVNLPLRFNVQEGFYYKIPYMHRSYFKEMYEAAARPVILHYTGVAKPWHKDCIHPLREVFWQYAKQSPWRNIHKRYSSKRNMMKSWIKILLAKLGVISRSEDKYISINTI